jgi:hypothetical protein
MPFSVGIKTILQLLLILVLLLIIIIIIIIIIKKANLLCSCPEVHPASG